jgi:SAM-dependent methyltransferase
MSEKVELICPTCASGMQYDVDCTFLQCPACANRFEIQMNVLLLSGPTSSWNLISTDMMKEINSFANEDTWQKAINKLCPQRFSPVINEDGRADWKYLLNIDSGSCVLDFGSGLGAISMSLAREGASVVALDKTLESLKFIKIRSTQEGLNNVIPICYDGERLPFPDEYFDLIVLNGALEWVVSNQAYFTSDDLTYENTLRLKREYLKIDRQEQLLKECNRILKNNGCVYIGIENRIAIKYFLTVPEDHMGIRFISLMPRYLADKICIIKKGRPYLARTHTKMGYKTLLNKTGFTKALFYMPIPDYRIFDNLVPSENRSIQKYFIESYNGVSRWNIFYNFLYKLNILDLFVNSYSIFSFKGDVSLGGIFNPIINKLGINKDNVRFYFKGRYAYRSSISVIMFHKDRKPIYIKMNKDPRDSLNIEKEYTVLLKAGEFCQNNLKGKVLETDIYELDRGRKALVQEVCVGKNLANYFLSLSYTRQLRTATLWLPELTKWLSDFHLKSTNLLKVNGDMVRKIFSDRLDMAKKVDEAVGSNLYDSVKERIKSLKDTDIVLPIGLIHGDFSPINILVEHASLYYIIDWEDANPEDCGLDDICNLFFSFGVRIRERNYENRSITLSYLFEFIRIIYRKLNSENTKDRNMRDTEDYKFYSDIELLTIMKQVWGYYSEKIGLKKEVIDLWFPLYIVKYAWLEISPSRNSLNKCKSWVNLFNKIKKDRFVFCQ